jgi:hypothetical protein
VKPVKLEGTLLIDDGWPWQVRNTLDKNRSVANAFYLITYSLLLSSITERYKKREIEGTGRWH